jgi:hypothetical protein
LLSKRLRENNDVTTTRTYALAAYTILLGILAFFGCPTSDRPTMLRGPE